MTDHARSSDAAGGHEVDALVRDLSVPPPTFAEAAVRRAVEDPELGCEAARRILDGTLDAERGGEEHAFEFGPIYALYIAGLGLIRFRGHERAERTPAPGPVARPAELRYAIGGVWEAGLPSPEPPETG